MKESINALDTEGIQDEGNLGFEIVDRLSSTPRQRGSATGQTCPDLLLLDNGTVGLIGEKPAALNENSIPALLVVPKELMYDALLKLRA